MGDVRNVGRVFFAALGSAASLIFALAPAGAWAQAVATPTATATATVDGAVTLRSGASELVETRRDVAAVVNSDPKVVTVNVQNRRALILFGVTEGHAQLRLLDAAGREIRVLNVVVQVNEEALEGLLNEAVAPSAVHVRRVGSSLVLSGTVANAGLVTLAGEIAQKSAGSSAALVNLLRSSTSDQVTVAVRVLEIRKSKLRSVGLKWAALNNRTAVGVTTIGNVFDPGVLTRPGDQFSFAASSTFKIGKTILDAYVDLLRTEGDARLLAAPTIVATSGKPAKFLAGGEFPIPVPNIYGGTATTTNGVATNSFSGIIYKQYGIQLAMTATVTADGRIDLQVAPEVSGIDYANAIEYGGNRVPAIASRRAEAELRLTSGESVVFAGLSTHSDDDQRTRLPFNAPRFLDYLAGPSTKSSNDTELVIIVTPEIGSAVKSGEPARAIDHPQP